MNFVLLLKTLNSKFEPMSRVTLRNEKKVLNFCHIPPPHFGLMISDTIFAYLNEWDISNKASTITLDNASLNDVATRHYQTVLC